MLLKRKRFACCCLPTVYRTSAASLRKRKRAADDTRSILERRLALSQPSLRLLDTVSHDSFDSLSTAVGAELANNGMSIAAVRHSFSAAAAPVLQRQALWRAMPPPRLTRRPSSRSSTQAVHKRCRHGRPSCRWGQRLLLLPSVMLFRCTRHAHVWLPSFHSLAPHRRCVRPRPSCALSHAPPLCSCPADVSTSLVDVDAEAGQRLTALENALQSASDSIGTARLLTQPGTIGPPLPNSAQLAAHFCCFPFPCRLLETNTDNTATLTTNVGNVEDEVETLSTAVQQAHVRLDTLSSTRPL